MSPLRESQPVGLGDSFPLSSQVLGPQFPTVIKRSTTQGVRNSPLAQATTKNN